MAIHIIKTGLQMMVQDMGRKGYRKYGVPISGCMDKTAAQVANILCGNALSDAVLEIVMYGAKVCTDRMHLLAFTGSGATVFINDTEVPLYRPILVPAGAVIDLRYASKGCRIYLAVAGGFDTPMFMGSRSFTSVLSMPELISGTILPTGDGTILSTKIIASLGSGLSIASWGANPPICKRTIRCLPGMEWDLLDDLSKRLWEEVRYMVSNRSNRMGYILMGAKLNMQSPATMISSAVMPGTIQLTPNGSLIILMSDAQTTGGYPRIAQVIETDLPVLAQCRRDTVIKFQMIGIEEAVEAYRFMDQYISELQQAIRLQFTI